MRPQWRGRVTSYQMRLTTLLAALPFALLANSSRVCLNLKVERDGSGLRQIIVDSAPYFKAQIPGWVGDVKVGGNWDMQWVQETPTAYTYARDVRLAALDQLGQDASLQMDDVWQNPWRIFTTYKWQETVRLDYSYLTDPLSAGATNKTLLYTVTMPGEVVEATTQPMSGPQPVLEGHTATFALDASQPVHTLSVTGEKVRWSYLLVLIYLLAYVTFRVVSFILYQLRIRPRKI
jgi:hypothetical protein